MGGGDILLKLFHARSYVCDKLNATFMMSAEAFLSISNNRYNA